MRRTICLLTLSIVVLTGCERPPTKNFIADAAALRPSDSIVIVGGCEGCEPLRFDWRAVPAAPGRLANLQMGYVDNQPMAFAVAPGRYRLYSVHGLNGRRCLDANTRASFSVGPGEAAYIGDLSIRHRPATGTKVSSNRFRVEDQTARARSFHAGKFAKTRRRFVKRLARPTKDVLSVYVRRCSETAFHPPKSLFGK